jgi:hypothetical protein
MDWRRVPAWLAKGKGYVAGSGCIGLQALAGLPIMAAPFALAVSSVLETGAAIGVASAGPSIGTWQGRRVR